MRSAICQKPTINCNSVLNCY